MWWAAAAQAGIGLYTGLEAAKETRRASRREALAYLQTSKENLRRLERDQTTNLGNIEGMVAAGGLLMSGSTERYANEVEREQRRQLNFEKTTQKGNYDAIRAGGRAQARAMTQTAVLNTFSTGLSAMGSYWNNKGTQAGTS